MHRVWCLPEVSICFSSVTVLETCDQANPFVQTVKLANVAQYFARMLESDSSLIPFLIFFKPKVPTGKAGRT